jgi:hypothetical protein
MRRLVTRRAQRRTSWVVSALVRADLRRAYVALPRSSFGPVAVGSVDRAWAGPTGRLTPRDNRPDSRGSRPLANEASGVERPPQTWAEWRGWRPIATDDASNVREIRDFRQAQRRSASVATWHENDQRMASCTSRVRSAS